MTQVIRPHFEGLHSVHHKEASVGRLHEARDLRRQVIQLVRIIQQNLEGLHGRRDLLIERLKVLRYVIAHLLWLLVYLL